MKKEIQNKKGIQLNQAFGSVLAVMLIGVLVIVSIVLFASIQGTFTGNPATVINETAFINATGDTLNNATDCNFASPSITNVFNATGNYLVAAPNYTVSAAGVLTNATPVTFSNVRVTYSYTNGGQACSSTGVMISNFSQYPALVGLVGTIVFLAIVIGVLVASFVFGGSNKA